MENRPNQASLIKNCIWSIEEHLGAARGRSKNARRAGAEEFVENEFRPREQLGTRELTFPRSVGDKDGNNVSSGSLQTRVAARLKRGRNLGTRVLKMRQLSRWIRERTIYHFSNRLLRAKRLERKCARLCSTAEQGEQAAFYS